MTVADALKIEQNWTAEQARNDIERYLLRDELPAYKAVAVAITALDKQIPKKTVNALKMSYFPACPNCDRLLFSGKEKYCEDCGQALDCG